MWYSSCQLWPHKERGSQEHPGSVVPLGSAQSSTTAPGWIHTTGISLGQFSPKPPPFNSSRVQQDTWCPSWSTMNPEGTDTKHRIKHMRLLHPGYICKELICNGKGRKEATQLLPPLAAVAGGWQGPAGAIPHSERGKTRTVILSNKMPVNI